MPDKPGWVLPALFLVSLLSIAISLIALSSGWFIIFQNVYYIPIIIACVYYSWRGFFVSVLLAVSYLLLLSSFTQDTSLIQEAMIRVVIFVAIAGVIAALSAVRDRTEESLREKNEAIAAVEEELRQQLEEVTLTEKALRESEKRYRNVVEDQTEFICRFRPDYITTFVNEAYCRYFGLSRDDILGKRFKSHIHPDDRELVRASFDSLTLENPVTTIDHRIILPDGEVHWHRWSDRVIFGDSGEIIEYQSVGQDITDRKFAEESYQTLFSEMLDGFALHEIICDAEGIPMDYRFLAVNPAFELITGLKADDLIGRTVLEVLPGTEKHWIETYGRVALFGEPVFFENYAADLDKHFMVRAFSPAFHQFACIFTDITGKKRAEEGWKKAYSQIEKNMYHFSILNDQVRNPLTVITGLVDLERGEHADQILHQVHEIDRIISLLDQGVLESASIRSFMERHNQLSDDPSW